MNSYNNIFTIYYDLPTKGERTPPTPPPSNPPLLCDTVTRNYHLSKF